MQENAKKINKVIDLGSDNAIEQKETPKIISLKQKKKSKFDDDRYELRLSRIALRYLKSYFLFDFLACIPILIYEATYKFSTDGATVLAMIESGWYWYFNLFKIFKILQYLRISEVLKRLGENADVLFPHKKVLILNMRKIMLVAIKFGLNIHLMTCLFMLSSTGQREEQENYEKAFIQKYGKDKTYEEFLEIVSPQDIFIACLYYYMESQSFIVMTQTTVGYGVPYPIAKYEMIFVMIV